MPETAPPTSSPPVAPMPGALAVDEVAPTSPPAAAAPLAWGGLGRRLWAGRALWLGVLAWLVALAGTLMLGIETNLGALVVLLGALLGLLAWAGPAPPATVAGAARAGPLLRLDRNRAARLVGIGLAGVCLWRADAQFLAAPVETFGAAGWLWLGSMAGLVAATVAWPRRPDPAADLPAEAGSPALTGRLFGQDAQKPSPLGGEGRVRAESRRVEAALFAGIVLLALVLRVWNLQYVPFVVHGDEILTGRNAAQYFMSGATTSIFSTVWPGINLPGLWFALVAGSLKLGGTTLAALRLPAALFGAATVIPFYGLVRGAWGRVAALAGAFILAVSAADVHYSRVTLNNIVTPFFWTLCFFFLLRGVQRRRPVDWVLAGLAAGLSEYGYYGTHLLPFILAVFLGYLLIVHWRQGWQYLGHFGLLVLGYLAGFGPLLAYFTGHPEFYFGRGAGVLMWDHIPRDWADWQRMWNTLWPLLAENLLGISTHGDQSSVYWAPLLLPAEAALLALGTTLLIRRWRHPPSFLILLSGLGVLFVGGTLVHGVPFVAHWTPAFPAFYAALAIPIGCAMAAARGRIALPRPLFGKVAAIRAPQVALAVGLAVLGWSNVDFYFARYVVPRPDFEIRSLQDRWEAALGPDYRVRVVGRTWQPYVAENVSYLVSAQDGGTLYNPAAELPLPGAPGKGLAFVFFPDDAQYQAVVQALYPGGTAGEIKADEGTHLFNTYVLTPAQAAAAYGAHLEVTGRNGNAYHWSGTVAGIGSLPADAQGPLEARWSAGLYLETGGNYSLGAPGGPVRLVFDGRPAAVPLSAALLPGWHRLVVTADLSGPAPLPFGFTTLGAPQTGIPTAVLWPLPPAAGLLAAAPSGLTGQMLTRIDSFLGFTAAGEPIVLGPGQGTQQPLRVRWTGELQVPRAGTYTLEVRTDGGARLQIDGHPVAAACAGSDAVAARVDLALGAGWHPLQLDYQALPGHLILELYWTAPDGVRALVPPGALRYAADTAALERVALPTPPAAVDCSVPVVPDALVPAAGSVPPPPARPPVPPAPSLALIGPDAILGAKAGLRAPRGVGLDAAGRLYIGDSGNRRIVQLDPAGKVLATWGGVAATVAPGKFMVIGDLAVTPDGHPATIDAAGGDVQEFTSGGMPRFQVPGIGSSASGIAAGPDGRLWIADTAGSRVVRLTAGGQVDAVLNGAASSGGAGFEQPLDVAIALDGTAYVLDLLARIVRLDSAGHIAQAWPVEIGTAQGGSHLAFWHNRLVWSDPDRNRLGVLDPATGAVGYAGSTDPLQEPSGVAAGPDGKLYVVDSGNARVQVFSSLPVK